MEMRYARRAASVDASLTPWCCCGHPLTTSQHHAIEGLREVDDEDEQREGVGFRVIDEQAGRVVREVRASTFNAA
eukprot:7563936-Heterocapsa_arctica.AAC.1